jgi:hypothetical protein
MVTVRRTDRQSSTYSLCERMENKTLASNLLELARAGLEEEMA